MWSMKMHQMPPGILGNGGNEMRFFSLFEVDLESWRFCLSAARMAPRRFLILWWDFVGVEGAMVGGETEGNKAERSMVWRFSPKLVILDDVYVCTYIW